LTDAYSFLLSNDAQSSSLMIKPIMYACMHVCMHLFIIGLFVCQNWSSSPKGHFEI